VVPSPWIDGLRGSALLNLWGRNGSAGPDASKMWPSRHWWGPDCLHVLIDPRDGTRWSSKYRQYRTVPIMFNRAVSRAAWQRRLVARERESVSGHTKEFAR
jgi:hypothetical protein